MENIILQDKLTGAVIGLARATIENAVSDEIAFSTVIEGLRMTADNKPNKEKIESQIEKLHAEKHRISPMCSECTSPCGKTADYDMELIRNADEKVRSLKLIILTNLRSIAVYAYNLTVSDKSYYEISRFLCEGLFRLGYEENEDDLLRTALKTAEFNLQCMIFSDNE